MNRFLIVVLATGCAGKPTAEKAAPVPASCTVAGAAAVLPRALADDNGADIEAPWHELVMTSCTTDRWPGPVVDCVSKTGDAHDECVALMPEDVAAAWSARVASWSAVWAPRCDKLDAETITIDEQGKRSRPDPASWHVRSELLAPPVTELPGDLDGFARGLRGFSFATACDKLGGRARRCFVAASTLASVAECRAKLSRVEAEALDHRLALEGELVSALRELYRRPGALECDAVVANHYGEAAWKGRYLNVPPAERTAMIAASRDRLRRACPTMKNSSRACVLVTAPKYGDLCNLYDPARSKGGPTVADFGFPASGVVYQTGLNSCDPYTEAVRRVDRCAGLAEPDRESIRTSFTARMNASDDESARYELRARCYEYANEVKKQLAAAGCPST